MQKAISSNGPFVEGIASQRPAGVPSFGPEKHYVKDLQIHLNPLEIIHSRIEEQCRQNRPEPVGKRTPCLPDTKVKELLTIEPEFTTFSMQFLKKKHNHSKSAKLGEVMTTHSKPSHITNSSQTFGRIETPSESLYTTIMPIKSDEQVNREYADFHRGHIISHNHFLPAEQINRGYTKPFDRNETFGLYIGVESNGAAMKKCLAQGDEHLTVVNKTWMDYMTRTKAPLGTKYEKYLYKVPDLNFGACLPGKCSHKKTVEQQNSLLNAFPHLHQLRRSLKKRRNFIMMDLISRLEKIDKEKTGHMPLSLILETMYKMHIRVQAVKIRTMLSHYQLLIDEGLATERINYYQFCRLISIRDNLPEVRFGIVPKDMDNKETTYRLFTSDRLRKPVEEPLYTALRGQKNDDNIRLSEIISPNLSTQIGLGASDFSRQRDKAQMERIFGSIISKEDFEAIWQGLMQEQKEAKGQQDGKASVNQFRAKIEKERPPAN